MEKNKISFSTALSVVVANMIGTGVFTSLGFQLPGIPDFGAIMLLWIAGGIIALLGSFAYCELGAAMPRSGGEYNYLSEIFHPLIGFLSGWVSATIGFAAPIAAASWALGKYMNTIVPEVSAQSIGLLVILLITAVQCTNYSIGGGFQTIATSLKVLLILAFIGFGLNCTCDTGISAIPTFYSFKYVLSEPFAISLVYVSFAYSGWNASSYIAGEVNNPKRNIPLSILVGTLIVGFLYVMLNYVFLHTAPASEMMGVPEVAFVSAKYIFGEKGGKVISLIISLLLISTISSMVIVGPRVIQMMGEDYKAFAPLSRKNKSGIPVVAIIVQTIIAITLLFTSSFEMIITYISFTLNLFSALTVAGVLVLRYKQPALERPYRTWGYPVTPILNILFNCWFLFFVFKGKPLEACIGLCIVALGAVVWWLVREKKLPTHT